VQMVLSVGFAENVADPTHSPSHLFLLLSCHHTRKKEHGERVTPKVCIPLKI
jgi:hypothetical protein